MVEASATKNKRNGPVEEKRRLAALYVAARIPGVRSYMGDESLAHAARVTRSPVLMHKLAERNIASVNAALASNRHIDSATQRLLFNRAAQTVNEVQKEILAACRQQMPALLMPSGNLEEFPCHRYYHREVMHYGRFDQETGEWRMPSAMEVELRVRSGRSDIVALPEKGIHIEWSSVERRAGAITVLKALVTNPNTSDEVQRALSAVHYTWLDQDREYLTEPQYTVRCALARHSNSESALQHIVNTGSVGELELLAANSSIKDNAQLRLVERVAELRRGWWQSTRKNTAEPIGYSDEFAKTREGMIITTLLGNNAVTHSAIHLIDIKLGDSLRWMEARRWEEEVMREFRDSCLRSG